MMRLTRTTTILLCALAAGGCVSYNAYERGRTAERIKNWDQAVIEYEKALEIAPDNMRYRIDLERARLEASRIHFGKGKTLQDAARNSASREEQMRLAQIAATELEVTVKLDPTNQYAAVELGKTIAMLTDLSRSATGETIDDIKKRAKANGITKEAPPQLVPSSDQPITLTFPRETPVKDIYKALGNAFGINMMFDQALKDDRISIELKDVTAQQALERVMQAANHFYKALDEHTIIIIPDNPQARRDYEDLVIRTFYLSNGDAELVTNVVRTMLEARNVFPLKALNAITIRDTADKVRIAEKIIEANDKAKAEVVVDVELLQLDLDKARELGMVIANTSGTIQPMQPTDKGNIPLSVGTINDLRAINSGLITFSIPNAAYSAVKSIGNSELLANPELRISEGEKASLHIGNRIPVPVTSFPTVATGQPNTSFQQVTSYQYQDVGIKVAIEPRVHHNREVTLKLTVEVSNQGPDAPGTGGSTGNAAQPTFITRTIESTIRLKDGETNFLAGLIQQNDTNSDTRTPFLGDLPVIGRLFTNNKRRTTRTDLVLTMTPHIIRIPDITEDDMAPMWVGTQNNLSFRGLSPRIESQTNVDPFAQRPTLPNAQGVVPAPGRPAGTTPSGAPVPSGTAPTDPFRPTKPVSQGDASSGTTAPVVAAASLAADSFAADGISSLSPRISPQPVRLSIKPGEEKSWSVVGMDLDGLTTNQIVLRYDPRTIDVNQVTFGSAIKVDAKTPPVVKVDAAAGTITITSSDTNPLAFNSGGDIAELRVRGMMPGETFLVLDNPGLKNGRGEAVASAVSGGRAKVE
jgi:general secretion pathway protein D